MRKSLPAAPPPYTKYLQVLGTVMANAMHTSGTLNDGRQQGNRGRRPGKPMAGINGKKLRERATQNMRIACKHMVLSLKEGLSVGEFFSEMLHWVHFRLPYAKQCRALRTFETGKDYGIHPKLLPEAYGKFVAEFQRRLVGREDPVRLAAWVEYMLRFELHPFAEGCGRVSTLASAWIMLHYGRRIPSYSHAFWVREEMHAALRHGADGFYEYYYHTCIPTPSIPFRRGEDDVPPEEDGGPSLAPFAPAADEVAA